MPSYATIQVIYPGTGLRLVRKGRVGETGRCELKAGGEDTTAQERSERETLKIQQKREVLGSSWTGTLQE